MRHELIYRNIAKLVLPPRVPKTKMNVWTDEQLLQFLEYAKPYRYYMIILLAATCGLRRGEAIALRWEDVDLKAGTITINQSSLAAKKDTSFKNQRRKPGNEPSLYRRSR